MAMLGNDSRTRQDILANRLARKSLFLLTIAAVLWFWNERERRATFQRDTADLHQMWLDAAPGNNPFSRCLDSDDESDKKQPSVCLCGDPLRPTSRSDWNWAEQHRRMVYDAQQVPLMRDLDVVLLGDSITERWNGTQRMGSVQLPESYRQVFGKYFDMTTATAEIEGMALGSSGDTTTELLWHLKNGVLNDMLQPRVWVLLIGTNDLGRLGCSKRTTLAGILNVAQYLHEQRPEATIIIHGLLPRSDHYHADPVDYSLKRHWQNIMFINRELKRFCSVHPGEWYYMEASQIFLRKVPRITGQDTQGAVEINSNLMTDALHPNSDGMDQWAPLIVQQVLKRMREKEKTQEDNT